MSALANVVNSTEQETDGNVGDEVDDVPVLEDTREESVNNNDNATEIENELNDESMLIFDISEIEKANGLIIDETLKNNETINENENEIESENKNDNASNNNENTSNEEKNDEMKESNEMKDDKNEACFQFMQHKEPIYCVSFNNHVNNNKYELISGSGDETLYKFEFTKKEENENSKDELCKDNENANRNADSNDALCKDLNYVFKCGKHKDTIIDCSFNCNGKYFASASMDCKINIYSNDNNESNDNSNDNNDNFLFSMEGPTEEIEFIQWHPTYDNILMAASRDATLWLYQIKKNKNKNQKKENKNDKNKNSKNKSKNKDKNKTKNENKNKKYKVLNVFGGHLGPILCGQFSENENGNYFLSGSEDGSVFIWDLKTMSPLHHLKGGKSSLFHESSVTCLDVNNDNKLIMTGSIDTQIILSNLANGKVLAKLKPQHSDSVECVKFYKPNNNNNNNNKLALSGSLDGTMKIWDVSKLKLRNDCIHEESIIDCQWFNNNEQIISSITNNGLLYIWDARNGNPIKRINVTKNKASIQSLDISYDNKYIVTGDDNCNLFVFDLKKI